MRRGERRGFADYCNQDNLVYKAIDLEFLLPELIRSKEAQRRFGR